METIAFLVQRVGPYHHARLCAWAAVRPGAVKVIEFRPADAVYAWTPVKENGGYERFQTHSREELCRTLDEMQPQVVVGVGYADPEINQATAWALHRRVPLVTCSDSTYDDEPRSWTKELFKRRIVGAFDAALVAGRRAHDYLEHLGLGGERRFQPWDVVDNAHFERGAELCRAGESASRERLKLPPRYFLCVARFVPKKNLQRLVEGYVRYARQAGDGAWSLVLSGSGPLEAELRASVAAAGLNRQVHFPGFLQYPDLPAYYGLAGAFVLPSESDQWGLVVNEAMAAGLPVLVSSRCGCAPDLVREGENGFTFDPEKSETLAERLTQVAGLDQARHSAMGQRSREIVAAFSPEAFARGLEAAVAFALTRRPARKPRLTRVLVNLLAMRSPKNLCPTETSSLRRGTVYFCFADPAGFSGQKAATELVINGLAQRGWMCRRLPQPVLDRSDGRRLAAARYLFRVLVSWIRSFRLLGARGGWLGVNLGQTRAAFLRDAIPLLLGRAGLGRTRVIISLHGSLFMQWANGSLEARVFRFLLHHAGTVTVLGEPQRARLLALGLPEERVVIVVNSCDLEPAAAEAVTAKHSLAADPNRPVRCLHLSSLIDTKGFPEYLESLHRLSDLAGPPIEAVLCGRLVASEFSGRFPDIASAESWINQQIAEIHRRARVRVRWVKGAVGADKATLFREADLFVLPTRYAVEAQPLVLLEAMASGCAIITTRAGEIPTILDDRCALFLPAVSTDALTTALQTLRSDAAERARLALAAHTRFVDRYQLSRHLDAWESLLHTAA